MQKKFLLSAFVFLTHIFIGCTQNKPSLKNQYILNALMVINETGCGYGTNLTDEQTSIEPQTFWNGLDKELCNQYQPSVILNFIQKIAITETYIFCKGDAEATLTVKPENKKQTVKLSNGWNKVPVNASTSYLQITLTKGKPIGEILVDAKQKYPDVKLISASPKKVLMNEFIGTNAFVDVPLGLLEPFGCVREYHDWPDWNEPQKDSFHLAVSKQGFDFENFYINLNKSGKMVIPTLQKSPEWLTGEANVQSKPFMKGANPEDPSSYSRHALYLTKYAQAFSPAGKGNIQYYENWNEQDKWWETGKSYFTPYQYASMSSADLDGHQMKMGLVKGIKNAGERNKLVMGGLANPKTDYLHALKYWCDQNRKGDFAWDVINYHRYSNSAGLPDNKPEEGICPEKGNVYREAKEIIKFRDQFLPNVEVWITEFGYDTENSPQQCKPIGTKNSELVQADWLIRSYILLSAAGIDKAFQYMIRDFAKSGLYATSGLYSTTIKEKTYIRPAWNYINTFKCALQDLYFEKLEVDSSKNLYAAIYANKNNPEHKTRVLWLGSQNGSELEYLLKEQDPFTLKSFSFVNPCGNLKTLTNNSVKITETPIIIQQSNQTNPPCYKLEPVNVTEFQCKYMNGIESVLVTDEQKADINPLFGLYSQDPINAWKTDYTNKGNNGIVFFIKTVKKIHSIQLFDGSGSGEVRISVKSGENWVIIASVTMNLYNKWRTVILNSDTKEIKIEKVKGNPDIGEIILYEKVSN